MSKDSDYVSIRISTLRGDLKIDFDTYVKINDKYILYLKKGDSFEGERLSRLKAKKLKKMYIFLEQEETYRQYLERNIEIAYSDKSNKSLATRTEIIQGDQQSNTEAVMENPENEILYREAKDAAAKFSEFLMREMPNGAEHIINIENTDYNIAHHGVTVSTYANALARKLGIHDPKLLQMLTLGCLLHDFEHFHSDLEIARPLSQFKPEELETYKQHPLSGARKVHDKKHFDQQVINIIAEHEEYIDGKGFPNGLHESKMDPLSVICASANALDRLITFEKVPKKEAVKKLLISAVGKHPLKHIQLLGEIMNEIQTK